MAMEHPELPAHREERSGGGGGVESSGGGGGGGEDQMDIMYSKRGCCFWIPCLGSDHHLPSSTQSGGGGGGGSVWWERIRTAEKEDRWWTKGWKVIKKVREWSEIVAGPKWKTFIRRFRKNNHHHHHRGGSGGGGGFGIGRGRKYNYDPLSYSLNFEEADAHLDEEDFEYPDFSSRYASIPISAKSSMDLGKDGPNFI